MKKYYIEITKKNNFTEKMQFYIKLKNESDEKIIHSFLKELHDKKEWIIRNTGILEEVSVKDLRSLL